MALSVMLRQAQDAVLSTIAEGNTMCHTPLESGSFILLCPLVSNSSPCVKPLHQDASDDGPDAVAPSSADKNSGSASKQGTAARAFQRVKVEEVSSFPFCFPSVIPVFGASCRSRCVLS